VKNALSAWTIAMAAALAVSLTPSANALIIFSDVTYTTNSITFTIDGDLTGYIAPQHPEQFSIRMPGDIFIGPTSGFIPNHWSASPFDNKVFTLGNLYNNYDTVPYTWSGLDGTLADAYATNNTVTVSWSEDWLDESASDPTLEFVWGNGHDNSLHTLLVPYDVTSPVPEPTTMLLLGAGLAGLVGLRRKFKK